VYNVKGVMFEPEKRDDRDRFYDGVGSKQGSVASQEPAVEIGKWDAPEKSGEWNELRLDLTRYMRKVGQYEIRFVAQPGGQEAEIEFRDWGVEMYGGKINDAVERLIGRAAFRLTRSQQTVDEFPTIFRVRMKIPKGDPSGVITIRRLTY
jgi:alpha-L-fucosidase